MALGYTMALGSADLQLKHSASQLAGVGPVYIRTSESDAAFSMYSAADVAPSSSTPVASYTLNAASGNRLRIVDGSFRWREGRAMKEEESAQKKALLKKVQAQLEKCTEEEADEKQTQCEEISELLPDAA